MKMLIAIPDEAEAQLSLLLRHRAEQQVDAMAVARTARLHAAVLSDDERKEIRQVAAKSGASAANQYAASLSARRRREALERHPLPKPATKNSLVMEALSVGLAQLVSQCPA